MCKLQFVFLLVLLSPNAFANVIGTDAQNFNPTSSGIDFVTVQSSETLAPGVLHSGYYLNYAVNSLPQLEAFDSSRVKYQDSLLVSDLGFGLGLLQNWDIGINFPYLIDQSAKENPGYRIEFADNGLMDIRVNSKYRVYGNSAQGVALVLSANFPRIENNPFAGSNPKPTLNYEIVADTTLGKWALGGNLGYRVRSPGKAIEGSEVEPLKNQWIASAAASYRIDSWRMKIINEVFGSWPAGNQKKNMDLSLSSAEWLLGLKYDVSTQLAVHAGVGTELTQGQASPDFRGYVGFNFALGPIWRSAERLEKIESSPKESRFRTQDILFDSGKENLADVNSMLAIEELAVHLKKGFKTLRIEGHTDSAGAEEFNLDLSQKRGVRVKEILVSAHQIDEKKIESQGFGESKPIADNNNYQGRRLNRRVEFVISY